MTFIAKVGKKYIKIRGSKLSYHFSAFTFWVGVPLLVGVLFGDWRVGVICFLLITAISVIAAKYKGVI